jgi:2-oxoglutarate ferredoxin oxidoreductase subunit beta
MVTATSPSGKDRKFGQGLFGPELVRQIAHKDAYIARASISNPIQLKNTFKKAIEHQVKNNNFSMVEVLSICPTNWKTNAKDSFLKLKEAEGFYILGEVK